MASERDTARIRQVEGSIIPSLFERLTVSIIFSSLSRSRGLVRMKGCVGALSSGQNNGKNYRDSGRRKEGGTRQIWGSPKPIQSPPVSVDRALQFLPQKKQKLRGLLLLLLLAGYIHKSEETKLTTIDLKIRRIELIGGRSSKEDNNLRQNSSLRSSSSASS